MQISHHRSACFVVSMPLLSAAAARAQTRILPFSTPSLPHWNADRVEIYNCSGLQEWQLFQSHNGMLQQRTSQDPTCQAFFGAGSLPLGITNNAGLDRWLPTFAEARFAVAVSYTHLTLPTSDLV